MKMSEIFFGAVGKMGARGGMANTIELPIKINIHLW